MLTLFPGPQKPATKSKVVEVSDDDEEEEEEKPAPTKKAPVKAPAKAKAAPKPKGKAVRLRSSLSNLFPPADSSALHRPRKPSQTTRTTQK
jgi:hypothetical protein